MSGNPLDKIKYEGRQIKTEVRKQVGTYIMASLGIVAGLAWNDAIRSLIEYLFVVDKNSVLAKFMYATLITLVVIVLSKYIMRFTQKMEQNNVNEKNK